MTATPPPAHVPTPIAKDERAKSRNIRVLATLAPFLRPYAWLMTAAIVALVLTAILSLALPMAVRRVIDGFALAEWFLLDQYFAGAIFVALCLALGTGLRYYLVTRLGERVVADMRKAVFDRTIGMSPAFFEKIMTGEVLSRITTDTTLLLSVIGSSVSVFLRNVLILIGGMALMLLTSAKLSGLVLLLVPLVLVPIILLGRRLRLLGRENQDWIAASSGNASEALLAVQTVQAFTHEAKSREIFGTMTEQSFESAKKRIGVRAVMTVIVIFLIFSGIVGVLWVGARDVQAGNMSPGELIQFVIYAVMVAGAVAAMSEIWGEVQRAAGATERLVELLSEQDTVRDARTPRPFPAECEGRVEFADVSFTYPARPGSVVLDGISFKVSPGETVALVGPSGAGKSTILQLMLRFFDPDDGRVTIDGLDLREVARTEARRHIAFVPQDPVIFATSARENIRFGRPDATDAEVEAAAKAAAAHEFLSALPEGYDTYVGERGVMLSGGQKQRIAIARAILRDAPILLLDEATSALDSESERAVQLAVEELSQDRTTLIVAHRLATVKQADRILVFENGRIVATGTHKDLVAEDGLYARLARLQFTSGMAAE